MPDDSTQNRDELDVLLDAALATYTDPGPSPYLRGRILSATGQRRRDRVLMRWAAWVTPAVAALLLSAILVRHRPAALQPPPSPSIARGSVTGTPPSVMQASKSAAASPLPSVRLVRTSHAVTPSQPNLARQDVFPTPTPLSPEEQALVALANGDAERLSRQIPQRSDPADPIEPLRVAAIHIPPLNPPDNGNN